MFNRFTRWPEPLQGIVYIVAGLTILLYAFGIMEKGFTVIIVLCALALVGIGSVKVGLLEKLMRMSHKR